MALLFCLSLIGGFVFYLYSRPVYHSTALVKLGDLAPADTARNRSPETRIPLVVKDLQSPRIIERTARRFGVQESAREIQGKHILKTALQVKSASELQIDTWPISSELAAHWAEALLEEYSAYQAEKHERDKQEVYEAYSRELKDAASRMGEPLDFDFQIKSQQDVLKLTAQLQKVNGLPADLIRMSKQIDSIGHARIKLEDARLDIASKLALIARVEKEVGLSPGPESPGRDQLQFTALQVSPQQPPTGNSDRAATVEKQASAFQSGNSRSSLWQELFAEQQRLTAEIAYQADKYPPGHRIVQTLQNELDSITRRIAAEYQGAKKRFEVEYQEILTRRSELQSAIEDGSRTKANADQEKPAPAASQKPRPDWERMIADMQKRIEALDAEWKYERIGLALVSVVDHGLVQTWPARRELVLLSFGIGILLALIVPLLVEYVDRRRHDCRRVQSMSQLRELGSVPPLKLQSGTPFLQAATAQETSLAANFAGIRTNLLAGEARDTLQVIMVTSAMPREGKTLVSANLGLSLAEDDARTLVVDVDLRGGRLHRLFGFRKNPGLADVKLGKVSLEEACRPTNHPKLWLLTAGDSEQTGADLLDPAMLAGFLATLRESFDRIVLDAPAVLGSPEMSLLQKLADGTLLVIRNGSTPVRNLKVAIEQLQAMGARLCGFVLNRPDPAGGQSVSSSPATTSSHSPKPLTHA